MNDTIEDLREISENVHEVMEKWLALVAQSQKDNPIPRTWLAQISFIARTNAIKESIFAIYEEDDPYSISILFRSLLEHTLKALYLFMRWAIQKSDEAATDYYNFCDLSEDLSYLRSLEQWANITDSKTPGKAGIDILHETKPASNPHSAKEIKLKANQFTPREILRYLSTRSKDSQFDPFIMHILCTYSELSSFVHGGPFSEREIARQTGENRATPYMRDIAEKALLLANTVKLNAFIIFLNTNRKFEQAYKELAVASGHWKQKATNKNLNR